MVLVLQLSGKRHGEKTRVAREYATVLKRIYTSLKRTFVARKWIFAATAPSAQDPKHRAEKILILSKTGRKDPRLENRKSKIAHNLEVDTLTSGILGCACQELIIPAAERVKKSFRNVRRTDGEFEIL